MGPIGALFFWRYTMPNYSFREKTTGKIHDEFFTIDERQTFLNENPEYEQVLTAPALCDPVRIGVRRIDSSFNDVLIKAKSAHLHSNINTF